MVNNFDEAIQKISDFLTDYRNLKVDDDFITKWGEKDKLIDNTCERDALTRFQGLLGLLKEGVEEKTILIGYNYFGDGEAVYKKYKTNDLLEDLIKAPVEYLIKPAQNINFKKDTTDNFKGLIIEEYLNFLEDLLDLQIENAQEIRNLLQILRNITKLNSEHPDDPENKNKAFQQFLENQNQDATSYESAIDLDFVKEQLAKTEALHLGLNPEKFEVGHKDKKFTITTNYLEEVRKFSDFLLSLGYDRSFFTIKQAGAAYHIEADEDLYKSERGLNIKFIKLDKASVVNDQNQVALLKDYVEAIAKYKMQFGEITLGDGNLISNGQTVDLKIGKGFQNQFVGISQRKSGDDPYFNSKPVDESNIGEALKFIRNLHNVVTKKIKIISKILDVKAPPLPEFSLFENEPISADERKSFYQNLVDNDANTAFIENLKNNLNVGEKLILDDINTIIKNNDKNNFLFYDYAQENSKFLSLQEVKNNPYYSKIVTEVKYSSTFKPDETKIFIDKLKDSLKDKLTKLTSLTNAIEQVTSKTPAQPKQPIAYPISQTKGLHH